MADSISGLGASAVAGQSRSETDRQKLADDLDDFMTLLTTQLQHQDPLDPMDANEFTTQLVQFASVEQQISQNSNLETLIKAQETSQLSSVASYVGRMAEVKTNQVQIYNGEAEFNYVLHEDSVATLINIQDDNGRTVFSGEGNLAAGKHGVLWDGTDLSGNQLPDGLYKLTVTALDADGAPVDITTTAVGKITGVSYAGDEPELIMTNQAVTLGDVISLKEEAIELSEVDSIAAAQLKAKASAQDAVASADSAQASYEAAQEYAEDYPITEIEAEVEKAKVASEAAAAAKAEAEEAYETAQNATSSALAAEAAQTAITAAAKASKAASDAAQANATAKALAEIAAAA
jgi:flagellar basal-body rod modification protein FlgD